MYGVLGERDYRWWEIKLLLEQICNNPTNHNVCGDAVSFFSLLLLFVHFAGDISKSGSAGLPHSVGRAHFIWGAIIHSHNDGKGSP